MLMDGGIRMSRNAKVVYCNCCGRKICAEGQQDKTSFLTIRKEWGYFSQGKDGQVHSLELCEACYDVLVQTFSIAPKVEQITEFL